jgi:imidazolonepropionase-like amidohydrolase
MQMAERGFRNALAEGVTIGCGSDAGPYPHGDNMRELVWMTRLGMSPTQALLAATTVNAGIVGKRHELSSIKAGYLADVIAVTGSPSEDISSVKNLRWVMKGGVIYRGNNG